MRRWDKSTSHQLKKDFERFTADSLKIQRAATAFFTDHRAPCDLLRMTAQTRGKPARSGIFIASGMHS